MSKTIALCFSGDAVRIFIAQPQESGAPRVLKDETLVLGIRLDDLGRFGDEALWPALDDALRALHTHLAPDADGANFRLSYPARWKAETLARFEQAVLQAGFAGAQCVTQEQALIAGLLRECAASFPSSGVQTVLFFDLHDESYTLVLGTLTGGQAFCAERIWPQGQLSQQIDVSLPLDKQDEALRWAVNCCIRHRPVEAVDAIVISGSASEARKQSLADQIRAVNAEEAASLPKESFIPIRNVSVLPDLPDALLLGLAFGGPAVSVPRMDPTVIDFPDRYHRAVGNHLLDLYKNDPGGHFHDLFDREQECVVDHAAVQAVRIQSLLKEQPDCACETLCVLSDRAILMRAEMSRGAYNAASADFTPFFASGPKQCSVSVLSCDLRSPNEAVAFIRANQPDWRLSDAHRQWLRRELSAIAEQHTLTNSVYVHAGQQTLSAQGDTPLARINRLLALDASVEVYGCINAASMTGSYKYGTLITEYGVIAARGLFKKTYTLYPWQHLVIQGIHPVDRGLNPSDLTRLETNDSKDFTAYIPECCGELHDVFTRFIALLRAEMPAAKAAPAMSDNFIHRGGSFDPALYIV